MWSDHSKSPSSLRVPGLQLHITSRLQALQPIKDRAVLGPGCPRLSGHPPDLRNGLALHLEIDLCVTVRRGWARVPQHVADGREIDAGLEKRYGSAVPHAVRMESFLGQGWRSI